MSYNHPYQSYQPSAFPPPPPPPPRQSSGSCYASAQTPTLPPRPSPTPGSPNVQDLTAGFTRLSTHGQPSTSQPYVPHAEYYQATSSYTWPTDHGASMSAASQAKYETPPPLPPRPSSQSPWQGSWQAPHSPPSPSYTPQQTWQQPPQSPWTAPSNQPSPQTPSPQWQQTGTYNRPPPPPPAELHSSYQSTCQCAWGQQCYVHPKQPADSSPQGTLTATPVQSPYQQDSYKKPSYQQTYYPPPQSNVPELASESPSYAQRIPQPISSPQSVQPESNQPPATHQPQPPQFVFEMEGSTPGMPEQKHLSEERKKVEPTREPVPEKLQRTFTDTLRQAGPYFYTPPVQAAVQEETSSEKEPSGVNAEPTETSPNATPDLGVRPESEARPPPHANASRCQDSTSHGGKETPLAGAVPRCYYLKIPNPPATIPTEQPGDYFVPYKCEYPQVNTYADVFWFNHIDVPDFRICGFCFETRIRQTAFASSFTGRMESKNLKLRCSFGAPRMADALWPQALQTGDLERVKGYMERRVQITNCHGVGGVLGKDASGVRWFAMRGNEIPGFISCEACLEENVIGTSFQDRFVPYSQPQGPDQRWACDLAIEYLRHGLSHALEASDWNAFVSMASHRVSIPACEGTNGVLAGSRKWYKPANNIPGVVICETCYVDQFGFTPFERNFVENPVQKEIANNQWSCDIAPISVKNAIEAAKQNSDFTPIQTTLSSLASNPICSAGAIASKTWYNLANNATNFDVCETCYIGLFSCLGLSHLFRAATTPQATTRICDLSLHSPRFKEYAFLYLAVINTPTGESTFLSHVSRFANIPSCSRRDPARNRRWHLLNGLAADLVVCEECHADFTEPTSLAHLLTLWPPSPTDSDPIPRVCDMYSPNMRARWSQLCAATAHDPSSSAPLDAFVAFSQHRHRVYEETMPRCRELLQVAKMRSQQHEVAGAMSSHYHSMALMTGGYGGYGWSGGHGGLYGGQAAAAGAQGVQLMMEMQADVRKVAVLEGRWEAVE